MRQYYKHHQNTVLNLINNSLKNCAVINSSTISIRGLKHAAREVILCGPRCVWEISYKQHLSYLVYSPVCKSFWPASNRVPFKRTLRLLKPCPGILYTQTPLLSLPKMGRFCLFAYTGLAERFRRARGFLYHLASLLKLIRSEKNNVLIVENFLYGEEQKPCSKQKCGNWS